MFVTCGIWCLADVSSVSPSSVHSALWWPRAATSYFTSNYAIVLIIFCNYFKKERENRKKKKLRKNK